jgi:GxxExxY protein
MEGRNEYPVLTRTIIGAAMRVHSTLGAGLLESVYEACLAWELRQLGLSVETQKGVPLIYRGVELPSAFRVDMLVEQQVVVEVKNVIRVEPVHLAQTRTYVNLSGAAAGLLINFNSVHLKDGIRAFRARPSTTEPALRPSILPSFLPAFPTPATSRGDDNGE